MPKFPRPTHYNTFNNPRWCARCGTQRGTAGGKFIEHTKPNSDKRCPNSGLTPAQADKQADKEYQAITAEAQ